MTKMELGEIFKAGAENPMDAALEELYKEPGFIAEMKVLLRSLDDRGVLD